MLSRASAVVSFLVAGLAACGGSTESDGGGTAGSGTAGSGTAGSGTAGSGTAGTGTAGTGTAGTGTAGSGTAGSGTTGNAACDKICPKDEQIAMDLGCGPSTCATTCAAQVAQIPAKCLEVYDALIECAIKEPSSSFHCSSTGAAAQINDGVCPAETQAIKDCIFSM